MKQQKTLFKNTIYKAILNIVNILIPVIIGSYVVRLLDVDLYGIYNKVYSEFQVFLAIASFGIYNYGVKEVSKIRDDPKKMSKMFTNLFVIGIASNLIILIIYLAYALFASSGLTLKIYLIFVIQILSNIIYVEYVNEALENYKFISLKSIIVRIIYLISLLVFVKKPTDIIIYGILVSLSAMINNLLSFIYVKRQIKFDFKNLNISKYIKILFIILIITNVDLLYSQLDRVMLGRYNTNISVTVYFIAYYIVSTLVSIPYSIVFVSVPRLSYLLKNSKKKIYEEKLNNSIRSLLFLIIPICLGIFTLSEEIIELYSGSRYSSAVLPLKIACISRIFISIEYAINNLVLYPNDKEKRILLITFVCGVLNLILNYTLVVLKIFNPVTAMATTGIVEIIIAVCQYIYTRKKLNIKLNIITKETVRYLIVSLCFIPVSYLVKMLNIGFFIKVLLIVIICSLMYVGILFIFKDTNIMFILEKVKGKIYFSRRKNEKS